MRLPGQYFSASVYKDREGMASNRVTELAQLANGEIWMATQSGISSFDGLEWITFPDSLNILPVSGYVKMKACPDTSLYALGFAGQGLSLSKFKKGDWQHMKLPKDLENIPIFDRFSVGTSITQDNNLHIGYRNKIYSFSESGWVAITLSDFPPSYRLHSLKTIGDSIFIASNHGLHLYHNQALTVLTEDESILDFDYDPSQGMFYLLGTNWLGSLSKEGHIQKYFDRQPIGLSGMGAHTNIIHRAGKIYYSFNSALYQYDLRSSRQMAIITQQYDLDYTCMKALFDFEGNLWIATLRGAFKINNLNVFNYNGNFLLENEVSAIHESPDGDLYLGSNLGLSIVRTSGNIENYPLPKGFIQPRVMDIVAHEGDIYLAANSAGVVRFKNGQFTFDTIQGKSSRVLDLHTHNGELYASSRGNLYRKTGAKWQLMYAGEPENRAMIRKILFDDRRKVLLTQRGVYDLKTGLEIIPEKLDEANIYSGIIHNGQLILGTAAGVRILSQGQITTAPLYDQVHGPVYSFLIDAQNRLWVGTSQGIARMGNDGKMYALWKSNGLSGNEVNRNAFELTNDGKIIVGTDEGVSIYDPVADLSVPTPTAEFIGTMVNGTPGEHGKLGHKQNNLRFRYRATSFFDETRINYRGRLLGLEDDWQYLPFHNQRSLLYANLKPGSYQFEVQARIGAGAWSNSALSPMIHIVPAFYDTRWFRVSILGAIILITYLLVRMRSKVLKARNEQLRIRVKEKTRELKYQNKQLVRTIRELKSAQGQLIQSEKLASMGYLTAGIAHELNNPLNYIRGGAECIMKNLDELNALHLQLDASRQEPDLMAEYKLLMDDSQQLAQAILRGASKSTDLVKSLGSFTADSQNFYSFTDLRKEVDTSLTLLSSQIGFHITINKMFGNIPAIECYPAKINQMLVNILLNAIQAIEQVGEITIRYYRKDDKRIGLEISDNGVGIPSNDIDRVFEPFYTTKDTNPGLGLAIVKSIVQEHNGSIKLESKSGKGTTVKIFLPVFQTTGPEALM